MKIAEFLAEFDEGSFPREFGPWVSFDAHDPTFRVSELNAMAKAGIVQMDRAGRRYRLTMKATTTAADAGLLRPCRV